MKRQSSLTSLGWCKRGPSTIVSDYSPNTTEPESQSVQSLDDSFVTPDISDGKHNAQMNSVNNTCTENPNKERSEIRILPDEAFSDSIEEVLNLLNDGAASRNRPIVDDVGKIFRKDLLITDIVTIVEKLDNVMKYHILKNHFKPEYNYKFPVTLKHGCNRRFSRKHLDDFKWMVYSVASDAMFCIHCCLNVPTGERDGKNQFVNKGFQKSWKLTEEAKNHESSIYHSKAMSASDDLIRFIEKPNQRIDVRISNKISENIVRNRHIVKTVAEAVLFCGRQCIALRGDNEKPKLTKDSVTYISNPGNLLAALQLISTRDEILRNHLLNIGMSTGNCKMTSPAIQNEIIEIIGLDILRADLVSEIRAAVFFASLADEVTSHNVEQLAICVRFVDKHRQIREEFLSFNALERISGEVIADNLMEFYEAVGIDIQNCRGQGYDGASNMSSAKVGVQAKIKTKAPNAVYVHCQGHCLNLVIAHSCSIPEVRNCLDSMKATCMFFLNSPKRNNLLETVITNSCDERNRKKALLDLCKTRWAERQGAYQHFFQAYHHVIITLENIAHGLHENRVGDFYKKDVCHWDTKSRSEAASLLSSLTSFNFIVVFLTVYKVLSHLAGITVKLQGKTVDLISAYGSVTDVVSTYKSVVKS